MQSPRQAPKVAFGTLIETGYLAPGAICHDTKRRWKATVRADGSLEGEGQSGSIHGLGAKLQGRPEPAMAGPSGRSKRQGRAEADRQPAPDLSARDPSACGKAATE
jgi:hypothetical protein